MDRREEGGGPGAPSAERPATALTIAGSDSGGGAGIQADLKAFAAHGTHGLSAITALTAQSTTEVRAIMPVPADFVATQIDTLVDDFAIDACKTGMIADPAVVDVVVERARRHQWTVVVDPVMVAATGARLVGAEVVERLCKLFDVARIITPNLDEVEVLLGERPSDPSAMESAGRTLADRHGAAVLVKGGHLASDPVDVLVHDAGTTRLSGPRILGRVGHGTGCTYAASLAGLLARGLAIEEAFVEAHAFVRGALAHGPRGLGRGSQPLHPLHRVIALEPPGPRDPSRR